LPEKIVSIGPIHLLVSDKAFCLVLETSAFKGGTFAATRSLLGLISNDAFCLGLETSVFEGRGLSYNRAFARATLR